MSTELVDPRASVRTYLEAEKSDGTRRAYKSDWADFTTWFEAVGEIPLPATPIAVATYLAQLADGGRKASTIPRRVASIRAVHLAAGHEPPTSAEGVKAAMRGIRRSWAPGRTRSRRRRPSDHRAAGGVSQYASRPPRSGRSCCCGSPRRCADRNWWRWIFPTSNGAERASCCISAGQRRIRRAKARNSGAARQRAEAGGCVEAWRQALGITEGPIFGTVHRSGALGA
jgi:hypothetical protein